MSLCEIGDGYRWLEGLGWCSPSGSSHTNQPECYPIGLVFGALLWVMPDQGDSFSLVRDTHWKCDLFMGVKGYIVIKWIPDGEMKEMTIHVILTSQEQALTRRGLDGTGKNNRTRWRRSGGLEHWDQRVRYGRVRYAIFLGHFLRTHTTSHNCNQSIFK